MKTIRFKKFLFSIILVLVPFAIQAIEIDGSKFDKSIQVGEKRLDLTGAGLFRYWGFKAYTGALYLESGAQTNDVLMDRAKRIELEYRRAIKGEDFGPATKKSLAKNIDADTFNQLRDRISFHNSLYEDVQPGDRYSLTYIPGKGTELALNNVPKGTIEGEDFASAIFSIWLGPNPLSKPFKKQLLGG